MTNTVKNLVSGAYYVKTEGHYKTTLSKPYMTQGEAMTAMRTGASQGGKCYVVQAAPQSKSYSFGGDK